MAITFNYVRGNHQSISHPAHKRRFPKFAKRSQIVYSDFVDTGIICDVNIISPAADLTFWSRRAEDSNLSVIFDGNDPYLLGGGSIRDKFRGIFKYFTGSHKYLEFNYLESYMRICKSSTVVISGHIKQAELLKTQVSNVHRIPDYGIDGMVKIKSEYKLSSDGRINVFWEGLGSSFKPFKLIEDIFTNIIDKDRYVFHFVTDLIYKAYGDKFGKTYIQYVAMREAPTLYKQFRFYQWSEYMMNTIAVACDFCIIPLPLDNTLNYWKPENKLIHMWRMGIPTIVSPIPSYIDVISKAGQSKSYAANISEWVDILDNVSSDNLVRKQLAESGYEYARVNYSDEAIDNLWRMALLDT